MHVGYSAESNRFFLIIEDKMSIFWPHSSSQVRRSTLRCTLYIIVYIPETYKIPCTLITSHTGYGMVWLSVSQFFLTYMLLEPK